MVKKMKDATNNNSIMTNCKEAYCELTELPSNVKEHIGLICSNILMTNENSQVGVVDTYSKILDSISARLQKDGLSYDEVKYLTEQEIYIGDKVSAKDSENKEFLFKIFETAMCITICALAMGCVADRFKIKTAMIPKVNL